MLLGRAVELEIKQDNQATIVVAKKGYSHKLRHVIRHHKVDLGSIREILERPDTDIAYIRSILQAADVFTKALPPFKWLPALRMLNLRIDKVEGDPSDAARDILSKITELLEPAPENPDAEPVPQDSLHQHGDVYQRSEVDKKSLPLGVAALCAVMDDLLVTAPKENTKLRNEAHRTFVDHVKVCSSVVSEGVPSKVPKKTARRYPGWGTVIELCTNPDSALGEIAKEFHGVKVIRITKSFNILDPERVAQLHDLVESTPGVSMHASLPCAVWSQWQEMCIHRYGTEYAEKLAQGRLQALEMLRVFIRLAHAIIHYGGEVSFEWPRYCTGWAQPDLGKFICQYHLAEVFVDGCGCGLVNDRGAPVLKMWRFICTSARQARALAGLRCNHPEGYKHAEISGSTTKKTERYTKKLCRRLLAGWFGSHQYAPALPVVAPQKQPHREGVPSFEGFAPCCSCVTLPVPLGVTKNLTKREIAANPKAQAAIRAEADALVEAGTWLLNTVQSKNDLCAEARAKGQQIHIGRLLTLGGIKNFEMPVDFWKHKGRICYMGNCAQDEYNAAAVYQDMNSSPSLVHSANCNIAYGSIPGHETQQSDAVRAYIQSVLKSKVPTYVIIPPELWPDSWRGRYNQPCCRLIKSLYGHPESGAHWERHLTQAIRSIGGVPLVNHPCSFWFAHAELLLTVYVDDLLLSGPKGRHSDLWLALRGAGIHLDDPEPLDRFLGRYHRTSRYEQINGVWTACKS